MNQELEDHEEWETIEVQHGPPLKGFLLFMFFFLLIALGFGFVLGEVHVDSHTMPDDPIRQAPVVTDWPTEEVFTVTDPVKKVDDLDMGWVVVKRADGEKFSVMVVPFRDIPVGSTVEIFILEYPHHPLMQKDFLVVAPPDSD